MLRTLKRSVVVLAAVTGLLTVAGALREGAGRAPAVTAVVVLPPGSAAWDGVRMGAAEVARAAALIGGSFTLHEITRVEADTVRDAALEVLLHDSADVLIAGGGADTRRMLLQFAELRRIPYLDIGTAGDTLRTCSRLAFHIMPREGMIAAARALAGAADTTRVLAWHPSLSRYGAAQLNERFRRTYGRGMTADAWASWMAVKVAWEAVVRARGATLLETLTAGDVVFDGHKGVPLSFHPGTLQLRQPVYIVADDSVLTEVPAPRDAPDADPIELLDRIAAAGAASCPLP